jgi:thioredoxin reductase (NADPH)
VSSNGEEHLVLTTHQGEAFPTRMLIVTAGHGAFEPRKLEVEDIDDWEGRGLHYFVRRKEVFKGKTCVIVGGGDSALDWTLGLQDTARLPITLVHRRDRFRALESSVNEARALEGEGAVRICTSAEVRAVRGDGELEAVTIEDTSSGESFEVECNALITLLGFHSHLGSIADGARAPRQAPGPRRPGDMETTPVRLRRGRRRRLRGQDHLISVGFGEAAIAANQAIAKIRGEKVQPKYSTD